MLQRRLHPVRPWDPKGDSVLYDRSGNVIEIAGLGNGSCGPNVSDTTQLTWNAAGQLVRVVTWPSAGAAHTRDTLIYDALGRRVGKGVWLNGDTIAVWTYFIYDGDQVVADVNASNAIVAQYALLGGRLFGMKTSSFTGMALTVPTNGTVVGLAAAASGAEIKRYDVLATPWGQQSVDTGTVVRFRMGSQEYDQEIGLYHLGARYYDPSMGRFLSEDPSGIAGGLNLYAYAGNDPVQGLDPTGLSSDSPPVTLPGIPVQACPPGYDNPQNYNPAAPCGTNERTCGYTMDANCTPGANNNSVNDTALASASSNAVEIRPPSAACVAAWGVAVANGAMDLLTLIPAVGVLGRGVFAVARAGSLELAGQEAVQMLRRTAGKVVTGELGSAHYSAPITTTGGALGGSLGWKDFVPGWGTVRSINTARAICRND